MEATLQIMKQRECNTVWNMITMLRIHRHLFDILFDNSSDVSNAVLLQVLKQFWVKQRAKTFVQFGVVTTPSEAGTQCCPSPTLPSNTVRLKLSMDQISYFPFFKTHFLHETPRKNRYIGCQLMPDIPFVTFKEKEDKDIK